MAGLDDSDDDEDAQAQQQDDGTAEPDAQRQRVLDSDRSSSESEGEGEDLLEDQQQDYAAMPALDQYERQDLDEREYGVDQEARLAAEAELDRREGRLNLVDRALAEDDEMELDTAHRDRRRMAEACRVSQSLHIVRSTGLCDRWRGRGLDLQGRAN